MAVQHCMFSNMMLAGFTSASAGISGWDECTLLEFGSFRARSTLPDKRYPVDSCACSHLCGDHITGFSVQVSQTGRRLAFSNRMAAGRNFGGSHRNWRPPESICAAHVACNGKFELFFAFSRLCVEPFHASPRYRKQSESFAASSTHLLPKSTILSSVIRNSGPTMESVATALPPGVNTGAATPLTPS